MRFKEIKKIFKREKKSLMDHSLYTMNSINLQNKCASTRKYFNFLQKRKSLPVLIKIKTLINQRTKRKKENIATRRK